MHENEIYAGINITGTKLQYVKISHSETDNSYILERVDEEKFEKTADFDNINEFGYLLLEALKRLRERHSYFSGQARLALPSDFFRIFKTDVDPRLHKSEEDEFLRLQRNILYPYLKSDAIIRSLDLYGSEKSSAVCLERDLFNLVRKIFSDQGIKVVQADHAHSAINLLHSKSEKPDGKFIISFHISVNYVSVIKLREGKLSDIYQVPKEEKRKDIDIVADEIKKFEKELKDQGRELEGIIVTDDNYKKEKTDFLEKEAGREITAYNPFENMNNSDVRYQSSDLIKFSAAGAIALSQVK